MSKNIIELVDQLPARNLTTLTLQALDFVVPGQWQNTNGFDSLVAQVTGENDPALIEQIKTRALVLYNDKSEGYQRAVWLYQTLDSADTALASAALANMVSDKIPLMGGLIEKLTPKADKVQSIDFALKIAVEVVAFCQTSGIPGDSIGDFVKALRNYGKEELMRLAALVCIDGLLPLGPDFLKSARQTINNISVQDLESNPVFSKLSPLIPGGGVAGQIEFIRQSFEAMESWIENLVRTKNLTPTTILDKVSSFIELSDDKLDAVGAFLDVSTNYFEHTGIQTVARRLIDRAYAEI
jgi:hypothetical protein